MKPSMSPRFQASTCCRRTIADGAFGVAAICHAGKGFPGEKEGEQAEGDGESGDEAGFHGRYLTLVTASFP